MRDESKRETKNQSKTDKRKVNESMKKLKLGKQNHILNSSRKCCIPIYLLFFHSREHKVNKSKKRLKNVYLSFSPFHRWLENKERSRRRFIFGEPGLGSELLSKKPHRNREKESRWSK